MTKKAGLKPKILSGYMIFTLFIILVGMLSILQLVSLGKKTRYLTNEVADEVTTANNISSEIQSMRTAVEKYVYQHKDSDRQEAEKHMKRVSSLISEAKKQMISRDRTEELEEIEKTSKKYIDIFEDVILRISAGEEYKNNIFTTGNKIEGVLYNLALEQEKKVEELLSASVTISAGGTESDTGIEIDRSQTVKSSLLLNALKHFLTAKADINGFVLTYDITYSENAIRALDQSLSELEKDSGFASTASEVRAYMEEFKTVSEDAVKMNSEIEETLLPLAPQIISLSKGVADSGWDEMKNTSGEIDSSIKSTTSLIIGTVIFSVIAGVLIALFMARIIIKPVTRVSAGLLACSEQVSSGSSHVAASSQDLAQGASEQAASIQETSSSLEEMAAMTNQNADNAEQANLLMKESSQIVQKASDSMVKLTSSMEEISKASQETSKIIKTIDEIAFQTNLLALNAAVEAARAGEAGAGFAVVADEVRSLAMRTAEAAKDTSSLIEGTVKKVEDGTGLVNVSNEAFSEVASSVKKGSELVGEIAEASKEQASGIDQVNKAVNEMDKVVQSNSANAEQSASSSEEMTAQAANMNSYVNELLLLVTGGEVASGLKSKQPAKKVKSKDSVITKRLTGPKPESEPEREIGKEARPEELIPFDDDDDDDFKNF